MIYKTISGDTFDKIAFDQYGDEKQASNIIEANIEHAHIVIFGSGTELIIPIIDTSASINLPPWKRGDTSGG